MSGTNPRAANKVVGQEPRAKKLEWYADTLVSRASSEEKAGQIQDAITDYLKATDILMLLAKDQENYAAWKRYSDRIEAYQKRIKLLIGQGA